jgi:hypothetical protein
MVTTRKIAARVKAPTTDCGTGGWPDGRPHAFIEWPYPFVKEAVR